MIYLSTVSFIFGVVFEKIFFLGWSSAFLVFLVVLFLFFYLDRSKFVLVIGLLFCLGIFRMSLVDVFPDQNLFKLVGQRISFEAIVSDEPDIRDTSVRYIVAPDFYSKSSILLVANSYPQFEYGDRVLVSGKLVLPKNLETFDYINYLAKDHIHFLMYQPVIEKIGNDGNKFLSYLYKLKTILIEKISLVVSEPGSSLLAGVIFGAKQSLGQDLLNDFRKVGLVHIVVLSGYNITIIAVGVFWFFSFWNKRNLSFILSAVFIILFALMVGLGATVLRACIMALIAILAKFLGRPADALRWLFIAGFLMILWNPLILFYDPSFQLSFMATLGLILFSSHIYSFISNHKISKFIPNKFGIREIVSSTFAVQFFVLPLLVKMSGFVSIISFFINPIILPLVPWTMASGALAGFLGLVPFVGKILSWPLGIISYFLTQAIIIPTEFFANIPFITLDISQITFWVIAFWYLGLGIIWWRLRNFSL